MARIKRPKSAEVNKFGGVDHLGTVRDENVTPFFSELSKTEYTRDDPTNYDIQSIETQSTTKLEEDTGDGDAAVIRQFEFQMNPITFATVRPTNQQLFNSHLKGIEIALWKDGLKPLSDVAPRVVVNHERGTYQIFVGAAPAKGQLLRETPQTLSQIAHG